jgi:iron complex transport system substrate-binding protein
VRLVSLLPSATEIVYALGLGDELLAVTFECDEPPDARRTRRSSSAAGTPAG